MDSGSFLTGLAFASITGSVVCTHVLARRRLERRTARSLGDRDRHGPHSSAFRPVVDRDRCIGCLSCLRVCPERDVLGLRDGAVEVFASAHCTGCRSCAFECPVGAVSLAFGAPGREAALPELGPDLESSRPGIHVVGELAGAPLIKDAARQGAEVGEAVARRLGAASRRAAGTGAVDVAVVGAGPAGIAAALALGAAGFSYRLLDRSSALSTLRSYPRDKRVSTQPLELPGIGTIGRSGPRDAVLSDWMAGLERGRVAVEENTEVSAIDGQDGDFTLSTSRGPIRARKVVLAVGRAGAPLRVGVPGEELSKVTHRQTDAARYRGARVLVVGGGDTALEAAVQAAAAGAAGVDLCHRGEAFTRCTLENRRAVEALAGQGRVRLHLRSTLTAVEQHCVHLRVGEAEQTLPNDFVTIAVGRQLPEALLERLGVQVSRGLPRPQASEKATGAGRSPLARVRLARAAVKMVAPALAALLVAATSGTLARAGWAYYRLDPASRLHSPLHDVLRPASTFGIAAGIVAAVLLATVLSYSFRKRCNGLRGAGSLRAWLAVHVYAGSLAVAVVGFHASFQATSAIASLARAALVGVAVTGFVGSHLWGRIKTGHLPASCSRVRGKGLLDGAGPLIATGGPPAAAPAAPWATGALAVAEFPALRPALVAAYAKPALSAWRSLHLALAVFLLVAVAAHVVVVAYLGFAHP